jgi:hypothetical protein
MEDEPMSERPARPTFEFPYSLDRFEFAGDGRLVISFIEPRKVSAERVCGEWIAFNPEDPVVESLVADIVRRICALIDLVKEGDTPDRIPAVRP